MPAEYIARIPIRKIPIVIDVEDPLVPEVTLDDFKVLFRREPDQSRHRIITLEVITSPDDQQPMLVSECGRYSRFLRREGDNVYFKRSLDT